MRLKYIYGVEAMNDNYGKNYTESQKISSFNGAVSQLYRLDDLWKKVHYYRERFNLFQWNTILDSLWSELSEDATLNDFKKLAEIQKSLVKEKFFISLSSNSGFNKPQDKTMVHMGKLYQYLLKKEIIMRRLQNKQGKGTNYQDSIEDYMD